jgi:hypothetical protein
MSGTRGIALCVTMALSSSLNYLCFLAGVNERKLL